ERREGRGERGEGRGESEGETGTKSPQEGPRWSGSACMAGPTGLMVDFLPWQQCSTSCDLSNPGESEQDENMIEIAGDDVDVPEELLKMVDEDATEEEGKDSILGHMQNLQNMDMDRRGREGLHPGPHAEPPEHGHGPAEGEGLGHRHGAEDQG
ncbi:hypothetical protein CRUP_024962, partial [Coryphaenoides rupestris]